jgi:hypothetical protein
MSRTTLSWIAHGIFDECYNDGDVMVITCCEKRSNELHNSMMKKLKSLENIEIALWVSIARV